MSPTVIRGSSEAKGSWKIICIFRRTRLRPGGAAYLVVQRNLGSDSLAGWLSEQGFAVERMKSKKGYRILEVRPS